MSQCESLISTIETLVFTKDNNKAYIKIVELLTVIDPTGFHLKFSSLFDNAKVCQINSTRIISVLIQLLTDKKFKLNRKKYLQLLNFKKNIDSLFRISGYHANQCVLNFFLNQYEASNNSQSKESNLYKLLVFMRLADHTSESLVFLLNIDKSTALPYILSLLSSSVIFQENELLVREQLLNLGPHFSNEIIDYQNSGLLAVAWMHTSYAESPSKHIFKTFLNNIMNNTLKNDHFIPPNVKPIDCGISKPKVLVLAEIFFSHHAMFRCYSNYIIQLKRKFEVVLLCAIDSVDENATKLFNQHITFDQNCTNIHQIAELIARQKADIIFYPSIGMSTWVITLLSIRFAPIQIAATGHPATTMCETIDYLIAPDFLLENEECYSEKLVTIPNALDNTHSSLSRNNYPQLIIRKSTSLVRIAVNGKSSKVNSRLLDVCEKINEFINTAKENSIEWVFFTNETGILHYHCEYEIKSRLKNASVIKSQDYKEYLSDLNQCDLALSPFPFGGSNSNIDLLRLGIPLVYLKGKEAHSRTDEFYYRNFDLTTGMSSSNINELIQNLLELIQNNEYRYKVSKEISRKDTDSFLISNKITKKTDIIDTFMWLWKNHKKIQDNNINKTSYKTIQSS